MNEYILSLPRSTIRNNLSQFFVIMINGMRYFKPVAVRYLRAKVMSICQSKKYGTPKFDHVPWSVISKCQSVT